ELKNVVERSVYRHGSSEHPLDEIVIDPFQRHPAEPPTPALPAASATPALPAASATPDLPLKLREFQLQQEKALLQRSLQQAKFNQKRAADLLALTYHQFRALLKKHQL
ncbi:phage shock protein operon transcriptional activator, partial [Salmonella enterica subsp. enterica serovar Stanley]|nr:phage shock protein operon transcriptional activator [Salmonella enterica subsp. enterica serovar Stanley]